MEIFEKLQKYKEGNLSYRDSVSLFFIIYPEKESALRDFLSSEDTYSRRKVKEGLQAKFEELVAIQEANKFKSFEHQVRKHDPINVSLLPEDLRKEHARLSPLIREVSRDHSRLDMCSTDDQRFELAKNIVTKWRIRQGIFDQIDRFNATGQVPAPVKLELLISGAQKPVQPLITAERDADNELKLIRLRSQRSKLKNKPHRYQDYEKVCAEIKEIENLRYA